jgi:hypothetical protein
MKSEEIASGASSKTSGPMNDTRLLPSGNPAHPFEQIQEWHAEWWKFDTPAFPTASDDDMQLVSLDEVQSSPVSDDHVQHLDTYRIPMLMDYSGTCVLDFDTGMWADVDGTYPYHQPADRTADFKATGTIRAD